MNNQTLTKNDLLEVLSHYATKKELMEIFATKKDVDKNHKEVMQALDKLTKKYSDNEQERKIIAQHVKELRELHEKELKVTAA